MGPTPSIQTRYNAFMAKHNHEPTPEQLIRFIAIENAMVADIEMLSSKELRAFAVTAISIMDFISRHKKHKEAFYESWGYEHLPPILDIGLSERAMMEVYFFDDLQKKNIFLLTNWIQDQTADIKISTIGDGLPFEMIIRRDQNKENRPASKPSVLELCVMLATCNKASMIIRIKADKEGDLDTVYGVFFSDGNILPASAEVAKKIKELTPAGQAANEPAARYKNIPLIFAKQ